MCDYMNCSICGSRMEVTRMGWGSGFGEVLQCIKGCRYPEIDKKETNERSDHDNNIKE